jgi:hypothetical protein
MVRARTVPMLSQRKFQRLNAEIPKNILVEIFYGHAREFSVDVSLISSLNL